MALIMIPTINGNIFLATGGHWTPQAEKALELPEEDARALIEQLPESPRKDAMRVVTQILTFHHSK